MEKALANQLTSLNKHDKHQIKSSLTQGGSSDSSGFQRSNTNSSHSSGRVNGKITAAAQLKNRSQDSSNSRNSTNQEKVAVSPVEDSNDIIIALNGATKADEEDRESSRGSRNVGNQSQNKNSQSYSKESEGEENISFSCTQHLKKEIKQQMFDVTLLNCFAQQSQHLQMLIEQKNQISQSNSSKNNSNMSSNDSHDTNSAASSRIFQEKKFQDTKYKVRYGTQSAVLPLPIGPSQIPPISQYSQAVTTQLFQDESKQQPLLKSSNPLSEIFYDQDTLKQYSQFMNPVVVSSNPPQISNQKEVNSDNQKPSNQIEEFNDQENDDINQLISENEINNLNEYNQTATTIEHSISSPSAQKKVQEKNELNFIFEEKNLKLLSLIQQQQKQLLFSEQKSQPKQKLLEANHFTQKDLEVQEQEEEELLNEEIFFPTKEGPFLFNSNQNQSLQQQQAPSNSQNLFLCEAKIQQIGGEMTPREIQKTLSTNPSSKKSVYIKSPKEDTFFLNSKASSTSKLTSQAVTIHSTLHTDESFVEGEQQLLFLESRELSGNSKAQYLPSSSENQMQNSKTKPTSHSSAKSSLVNLKVDISLKSQMSNPSQKMKTQPNPQTSSMLLMSSQPKNITSQLSIAENVLQEKNECYPYPYQSNETTEISKSLHMPSTVGQQNQISRTLTSPEGSVFPGQLPYFGFPSTNCGPPAPPLAIQHSLSNSSYVSSPNIQGMVFHNLSSIGFSNQQSSKGGQSSSFQLDSQQKYQQQPTRINPQMCIQQKGQIQNPQLTYLQQQYDMQQQHQQQMLQGFNAPSSNFNSLLINDETNSFSSSPSKNLPAALMNHFEGSPPSNNNPSQPQQNIFSSQRRIFEDSEDEQNLYDRYQPDSQYCFDNKNSERYQQQVDFNDGFLKNTGQKGEYHQNQGQQQQFYSNNNKRPMSQQFQLPEKGTGVQNFSGKNLKNNSQYVESSKFNSTQTMKPFIQNSNSQQKVLSNSGQQLAQNNLNKQGGRYKQTVLENSTEFHIDLKRIEVDGRTTLMIKNIPNKYEQDLLLQTINRRHINTYDFFYLPIDFSNNCNVGYAFINFKEAKFIEPFYKEFNDQKWKKYNSDKICQLCYARIQGSESLNAHFRSSSVMNQKDGRFKPLFIDNRNKFVIQQIVDQQKKEISKDNK